MNEPEKRVTDDAATQKKHDFGAEIMKFIDDHGYGLYLFAGMLLFIFPEVIPLFLGLVFSVLFGMLVIGIFIR